MTVENSKLVRLAGIVAVIGAAVLAISDMLMLAATIDIADYPKLQAYVDFMFDAEVMVAIPYRRLVWGGLLGVLALPAFLAGVWHVHQGLKSAGRRLSMPPTLLFAYAFILSPFIHGSFIYLGEYVHALNTVDTASQAVVVGMVTRLRSMLIVAYGVALIFILIGSIWFSVAVASRKTLFPRWMALANPVLIDVGVVLVCLILPKSITLYIWPAGLSITFLIFFALTTRLLWRVEKRGNGAF